MKGKRERGLSRPLDWFPAVRQDSDTRLGVREVETKRRKSRGQSDREMVSASTHGGKRVVFFCSLPLFGALSEIALVEKAALVT